MEKKFNKIVYLLTLVLLLVTSATSFRVLGIFPHPGKSHFDVFHPLMTALAEKGHDVHVVTHFTNNPPIANYTDISLAGTMTIGSVDLDRFKSPLACNHFAEILFLFGLAGATCEAAYSSPNIQKLINSNQHFDVIIVEAFQTDCILGIAHKFKAPIIALSSTPIMPWAYDRFGNPANAATIPVMFLGYHGDMSFWKRVNNVLTLNAMKFMYYLLSDIPADKLIRRVFGPDVPSVADIRKNTTMLLTNTHYSLFGVRPLLPSIVEIGGIHIKPAKPLSKDLEDFINGAEYGVVYVSWGSMIQANTLPDFKRDALLKAFGSLKQRVLWKFENETLPGKPENVMIKKWMPQRDILAHKNVRVFMAHGGLLGTLEAVHSGVPVVGTPVYGDQYLNTNALINNGMGVQLSFFDLTTENIIQAINTVLQPSYAENAKKASRLFKDRPMAPLETAVWWVEHVARTGGTDLLSPARNMPLYQYLLVDVIGLSLLGTVLTIYITHRLIKRISIRKSKSKKD